MNEKTLHIFTYKDTFFSIVEITTEGRSRRVLRSNFETEKELFLCPSLRDIRQACDELLDEAARWATESAHNGAST